MLDKINADVFGDDVKLPNSTMIDTPNYDQNIPNKKYVDDVAKTAALWQGSKKFVSPNAPTAADGAVGDIWIKYV
jgi:hypothetical protein